MVKIIKGTETDKWLPKELRKGTFPILRQPASTSNDITGSAFLLQYKKKPFIITAKHVIDVENPVIAFRKKNGQVIGVNSSSFQQVGIQWVKHPFGLDIAAIPFVLPLKLVGELDLGYITEDKWTPLTNIPLGGWVAHLGYPEKGTSRYSDGSPCILPQAMPGKIIKLNSIDFVMETAGANGASGGPVFLRSEKGPSLVGIAIEARKIGQRTRPWEADYCNQTKALVISLIKDVLESEEMNTQFLQFGDKLVEMLGKNEIKRRQPT
ncbi:MAG TPA: hypothetical protein VLH35_02690 [Candidatus Acidoferrales bacterium]|nr:hypothetical protein [Candidatus Acidoferrales bacterium]